MELVGGWSELVQRTLEKSAAWHAERAKGIGGSDAGKIMSGEWLDLWREKTGRAEPENLLDNLAVCMGSWTEALNRYWFAKVTGIEVVEVTAAKVHRLHPFMRANLDGRAHDGFVFEAKHVNAFTKDEELVSRYYAQCQHLMAVTEATGCYLSAFFGSAKWAYFDVARDDAFITELIERERAFWSYVEQDVAPPSTDAAAPVEIQFDQMREVDLSSSNAWRSFALDWMQNRAAAKTFEVATKELKAMVGPDVRLAFGAGIQIARSKAGALSIKEIK